MIDNTVRISSQSSTTDLEPPDLETKVAILKRKAEAIGFVIRMMWLCLSPAELRNNVRELEGSLIRLVAISSLRGIAISKDSGPGCNSKYCQRRGIRSYYYCTNPEDRCRYIQANGGSVALENNSRQFAFPRQIAMYLCKKLTKHSYPEIGRAFGGKHHTTVIHSFEKIQSLSAADAGLQRLLTRSITEFCKSERCLSTEFCCRFFSDIVGDYASGLFPQDIWKSGCERIE